MASSDTEHAAERGSFENRRGDDDDDNNMFDMHRQQGLERMSSGGGSYDQHSSNTHDFLGYSSQGQGHDQGGQWDGEDSNMFDGL